METLNKQKLVIIKGTDESKKLDELQRVICENLQNGVSVVIYVTDQNSADMGWLWKEIEFLNLGGHRIEPIFADKINTNINDDNFDWRN